VVAADGRNFVNHALVMKRRLWMRAVEVPGCVSNTTPPCDDAPVVPPLKLYCRISVHLFLRAGR